VWKKLRTGEPTPSSAPEGVEERSTGDD
jgi:hypothetical protein